MSVTNSIVSPQHNRAIMGLTQESATNAYRMTNSSVIINRARFQQIVTATFNDLSTTEITQRIDSLLKRLERTRAEKLTVEGKPHHQHLIDNAVTVRLAELYQSRGVAVQPSVDGSAGSCPPANSDLRRAQTRARDILEERYWRDQFAVQSNDQDLLEERKEERPAGDQQQWLYARFARENGLSAEDLALLNGTAASERRTRLKALSEEMAEARKDHREAIDQGVEEDELRVLRVRLTTLTDAYNNDKLPSDAALRRRYQEWFSANARIDEAQIPRVIEQIITSEEVDRHYVTGRELFSILYPEDYFYSNANNADPLEPVLRVEEGIKVEGQHNKSTVGATHGSMVGDLFKMYSRSHAEDFISRAKWLTDAWAASIGQSLTLYSCQTLDPSFADMLKDRIRSAKIEAFKLGPRSNNPLEEVRRQEVLREIFSNVKGAAGKCAMDVMSGMAPLLDAQGKPVLDANGKPRFLTATNPNNALLSMAVSGSKGNKENISSFMTMVGPQEFQGRPIPMLPGGRSIPSFERNSREPGARGFVESNYLDGMTPAEFFLHQYAAREGLFGTALKTAETGYMQRRILKAMEDATVYPDNTVRNALGVVIQYAYGEDGFSGDRLVMTRGRARFVDARRLLNIIQSRRRRGMAPLFKPPTTVPSRTLPRAGYVMPSFEGPRRTITAAVVEEENEEEEVEKKEDDDDKEDKPDEEEPEEEEMGSDISEGEAEEYDD